jgi:uncharacterized coiled-coil DUF342 family protein
VAGVTELRETVTELRETVTELRETVTELCETVTELRETDTQWVWKVSLHLRKVLEVMSTSVYTG